MSQKTPPISIIASPTQSMISDVVADAQAATMEGTPRTPITNADLDEALALAAADMSRSASPQQPDEIVLVKRISSSATPHPNLAAVQQQMQASPSASASARTSSTILSVSSLSDTGSNARASVGTLSNISARREEDRSLSCFILGLFRAFPEISIFGLVLLITLVIILIIFVTYNPDEPN